MFDSAHMAAANSATFPSRRHLYNPWLARVLDLRLFPPEIAKRELAWYREHQNAYGLPLDSRATFTKPPM